MSADTVPVQRIPMGQRGRRVRTPGQLAKAKADREKRIGVPLIKLTHAEQNIFKQADAAARQAERDEHDARCKAAGMRKIRMGGPNGQWVDVWVFRSSYLTMGFSAEQVKAAERFGRDWEAA